VTFLQLILFANTTVFFCSLLGLVSHCFWEGDSREEIITWWRCVENINDSRHSLLVLRSLQASFTYLQSYPRKFHLCLKRHRTYVHSSFFFLEKHYIPQYNRWLTCHVCARLCQCFGQGGCYFRCDKLCICNNTCTQRLLLLSSCTCLNSLV